MRTIKSFCKVLLGILALWFVLVLFLDSSLYRYFDESYKLKMQLKRALEDLEQMKLSNEKLESSNEELHQIKRAIYNQDLSYLMPKNITVIFKTQKDTEIPHKLEDENKLQKDSNTCGPPSLDLEKLRRKSENGIVEFWYYLKSELSKLKKSLDNTSLYNNVQKIYKSAFDRKQTLLVDMYCMSKAGGLSAWRKKEAKELRRIVQNRLHYLQNPEDCSTAKKLVCNINKACGFGCQLHHLVYCFIIAYATERTFFIKDKGWRYSPNGWQRFFLPLSENCTNRGGKSTKNWNKLHLIKDVQVVNFPPNIDPVRPIPEFMPYAVPQDLGPRLTRLHGQPIVWWIGQFINYLTRPNPELAAAILETEQHIAFQKPIVGLHVRRTDKIGTEASFHAIEEYMVYVDEYFDLLDRKHEKTHKRRIFLATDDPKLQQETKDKFPNYEVVSDNRNSRSANLKSRYSEESLRGIIIDMHLLAQSDFLVCTFSSRICRASYEVMQTLHPDASTYVQSLDDIYFFAGGNRHDWKAVYSHEKEDKGEISFQQGDVMGNAGNHWDGYSKGSNRNTHATGLFPSYKIVDTVVTAKFPDYRKADKKLKLKS